MKIKDILNHPKGYFFGLWETYIEQAEEEGLLYEGLILSHSADVVAASVGNILKGKGKIHKEHPHVMAISMTSPVDENVIRAVIKRFEVAGWTLVQTNVYSRGYSSPKGPETFKNDVKSAIARANEIDDKIKIDFIFESKYGTNITDSVIQEHKYLYHATPSTNVEKILKKGLTPRSGNKMAIHPDRVYLTFDEDTAYKFSLMVNGTRRRNKQKPIKFTILKIDTKAFDNRPGVILYTDPAFRDGVFTHSNIRPSHISIVREILAP